MSMYVLTAIIAVLIFLGFTTFSRPRREEEIRDKIVLHKYKEFK